MNKLVQSEDRQIRVFISSTFRDMMRERDVLVKKIFPELRRKCARRFVTFTEVDLRWGITEEEVAEGKVLPICLEEIQRCRPYFIGLLGERYGWIPDRIPESVLEREPWLQEHVKGQTSVTELEILHGVLNEPAMRTHAFFYFRNSAYLPTDADPMVFQESDPVLRDKLVRMKERIRMSGFPVVENYTDSDVLGELVRAQFDILIDELYPEEDAPSKLTHEAEGHAVYARQKLFACIDRPVHMAALTVFAEAERDGQGLVVTGESGGGKTALLAAWARQWATSHPNDFLLQHYFGATPDSTSPVGFLNRLLGELKLKFDLPDDIPTDLEKLREALPLWLAQTVNKGRILLVLDGLNQVQGSHPDRLLAWLPRFFPAHVTVIASTLLSPALDALRKRGWHEHDLTLADTIDIDNMVTSYLSEYRRTLAPVLRRQLLNAPGSKNPLFLRTVLEELRQFGSFEQLPTRVAYYLEATTPRELFVRVLRRWEQDFGADRDLVRRALSLLWAARQGLSETEWIELMADTKGPMDRLTWSPLFFALDPHLVQLGGLYAFGHDFLRQAVEMEYLTDEAAQKAAHLVLADYFEYQEDLTTRVADEWPWQLHAVGMLARLESCLTNEWLFHSLRQRGMTLELAHYWYLLREAGRNMGDCYKTAYGHWSSDHGEQQGRLACALGLFLAESGELAASEKILRCALQASEKSLGSTHFETLRCVGNLGNILHLQGNIEEAKLYLNRALELATTIGPYHPDTLKTMNIYANLLNDLGDYAEAGRLYRRAYEMCIRALGSNSQITLDTASNLALFLEQTGRIEEAEPLTRSVFDAFDSLLGPENPHTLQSANNLALLLQNKCNYMEAERLQQHVLNVRERVLGSEHPDTLLSVHNLAVILYYKGDQVGAEHLYRRAIKGRTKILGPNNLDTVTSMNSLSALLTATGNYTEAENLAQQALSIRRQILGAEHPTTLKTLSNVASILSAKGDYEGAEPLLRQVLLGLLEVSYQLGNEHPDFQLAARNYITLLMYGGINQKDAIAMVNKLITSHSN